MLKLQLVIKRMFDFVAGLILLVLLSPLLLIIAILIKTDSKGPVFFTQIRMGYKGKPFKIYKFRTMKVETDPYGDSPSDEYDPRITKSGKWLRETSLDELAQIFNIISGEMSFVGPRPLLDYEIEKYDNEKKRLEMKPGVTGWAQVNGRNELDWDKKIAFDIWYCENFNLWLDIKIFLKTVSVIFKREGIYDIGNK